MRKPIYNDYFPLTEYENRLEAIRAAMRREGFAALLLSTESNVVYTSGFLNGTWPNGFHLGRQFALIPVSEQNEPVLICPTALTGSLMTSAFSDVYPINEPEGTEGVQKIADLLAYWDSVDQRIGIEKGPAICPSLISGFEPALKRALPQADFHDCSGLMAAVRQIKSPREIEKIRRAVEISETALFEAFEQCHTGMSEREVAGQIALSMARQSPDCAVNHPWFIYVHATGKSRIGWDGIPSEYIIRDTDLLYIDCGFIYQGYTADMIRVFSFGNPDPRLCQAYEAARQVNETMISALRPGLKIQDLMVCYERALSGLGLQKQWDAMQSYQFLYAGHGIGLDIHEPPFISAVDQSHLEAGMTLAIEPDVFFNLPLSEQTVALKPENDVLITAEGGELLTTSSTEIWRSR